MAQSDLDRLKALVGEKFEAAFGRTPLPQRLEDILAQATTLGRFADLAHLRDEAGDLLSSALQLCNECDWDPADLVRATLDKIDSRKEIYERLGRKLKVGILGGAFDPIHDGHLQVAAEVLRVGGVDEVWLMPCYEHLAGKSMAAPEHRLEMCRLATQRTRGVGIFDYEIRHQFRGETYHLVKKLLAEEIARVRCDFSLIIGQDNADGFASWTNAEGLERIVPFIVVPRAGLPWPKPSAWYLWPPHRYLDTARGVHETSSTEVRNRLRSGDPDVARLVCPEVLDYIQANGLYQPDVEIVSASARTRKVVVFPGSFDPPTRFHLAAAERLVEEGFGEVIICPSGPRAGRGDLEHAAPVHRAAMVDLTFREVGGVSVDLHDLDESHFSHPTEIEARHAARGEVWFVVGSDMLVGGRDGRSVVHNHWEHGPTLWKRGHFVVFHEPDDPPDRADLPEHHRLVPLAGNIPSADIRTRIYHVGPADDHLTDDVSRYIERHRLFLPGIPDRVARIPVYSPRLKIVHDDRNPRAGEIAARYRALESPNPDLVLVIGGDGTMLHAIRRHWRLRIPFLGLNAGHLGFLMNERLPHELDGLELVTYTLPMLRVEAELPDGRVNRGLAFGDCWLEREGGQAAWIRLDVDGQTRIDKVVGDGLLVATAAGSSAYARAMGASPVPLNTPVLTLAGSNVFRPRFWKPMILVDDAVIKLASLDRSGKRPVRGFLDGQPLGVVQELSARRSCVAGVELAFTREFDPSGRLLRSLFPPVDEQD